jgi:hypothetical protein
VKAADFRASGKLYFSDLLFAQQTAFCPVFGRRHSEIAGLGTCHHLMHQRSYAADIFQQLRRNTMPLL